MEAKGLAIVSGANRDIDNSESIIAPTVRNFSFVNASETSSSKDITDVEGGSRISGDGGEGNDSRAGEVAISGDVSQIASGGSKSGTSSGGGGGGKVDTADRGNGQGDGNGGEEAVDLGLDGANVVGEGGDVFGENLDSIFDLANAGVVGGELVGEVLDSSHGVVD